jgi:hypothetical protein
MIRLGFSVARGPTAFRAALAQLALSPLNCIGLAMPRTTLPSLTSAGCL